MLVRRLDEIFEESDVVVSPDGTLWVLESNDDDEVELERS